MLTIVEVNERGIRIGDSHQNARYTNLEVEQVLTMRDEGLSYGEIMRMMEMPKSTVACICKATRRCQIVDRRKTVRPKPC